MRLQRLEGVERHLWAKGRPMRMLWRRAMGVAVVCVACTVRGTAAPEMEHGMQIPRVRGTSFAGSAVELPEAFRGKVGVLVIGFSQGSREAVTAWGRRLAGDYLASPGVVYFEMPVLAAVPRLLRGAVMGTIKASVAEAARPHFVPLVADEAAWRKIAGYSAPDEAYVLVVDGEGAVRWQTHGAATDAAYGTLKQQVARLGELR